MTGNEADLAAMPEELSVKTVDLAEMKVYSQTLTVNPNLPSGIISLNASETVEVKLELVGLTTKEITVPVSQIERKNDDNNASFGTQSIKIQLRGKPAVLEKLTASDLRVVADLAAGYDAKTKDVTLEVSLVTPAANAGVIGGPYTVPVILSSEMES